ncbi:unnamed protein product, partial [Urochloa humidicola]
GGTKRREPASAALGGANPHWRRHQAEAVAIEGAPPCGEDVVEEAVVGWGIWTSSNAWTHSWRCSSCVFPVHRRVPPLSPTGHAKPEM